jgi:uncharacterized membrane protein YfcA
MSELGLLLYGLVSFVMSILSGASGGGGGFLLTPLMIFLGLSPAQAVANGKFGGLSVSVGSLVGLKHKKVKDRKLFVWFVLASIVIGLIAPQIIVSINPEIYENIIGLALVVLSPLLLIKKIGYKTESTSKVHKIIGICMIVFSMFMVAIFSSGLGIFMNIAMMGLLGLNAIDASIAKRMIQLVGTSVIIVGLSSSGLFLLDIILVSIIANGFGGFIGGRIALKRGAAFVSILTAIAAAISGLVLLFM